jgi:peptide/nickel transport system substrate-binding protein
MRWKNIVYGLFISAISFSSVHAESDVQKKVFTYALKADTHSMDPMALYDVPSHSFHTNIYETLVDFDHNLKIQPCLAKEWSSIEDTKWRFKLRDDVKFHDGSPFTADDVIFSLQRAKGPGSDISGAISSIRKAVKIDDYTVDIITFDKNPILPNEIFALYIMSKAWCEKHGCTAVADVTKGKEGYADRHENGSGPFKLVSRNPDVETIIEKNQNWWGVRIGNVDKAVYKVISSDSTRIAGLLSGELDFINPVPIQDIKRVQSTANLEVLQTSGLLTLFYIMNMRDDELATSNIKGKNPFKDRRVREAIYRAINIQAIHKKIMRNSSRPTGIAVAPGVNGYAKELDTRLDYDIKKAKDLLKEAGYANGFSVAFNCPNDRYMKDEMICQSIANMISKIGIKTNLTAETKSRFFAKALGFELDMQIWGWMPGTYDSHDALYNIFATRKGSTQGKFNVSGYANPKLDDLIEKIHVELDATKRNELIKEALKLARDDIAVVPLHNEMIIWGKKKNISVQQRSDNFLKIADITVS